MDKKLLNFCTVILVFVCGVLPFSGLSQSFERVEISSGLGILEENNAVAIADYDGDNDLDIFVVANAIENPDYPSTFSRLYQNNNNGSFTDVTESSGLVGLLTAEDEVQTTFAQQGYKFGASWGDYNNDGFPDLFLTYSLKVQLWRNLGNGTFANVTEISGLSETNDCLNMGATWFDYNNDGFLDIYITDWNRCESNSLYRNNGNNTFTNVTAELNMTETESNYSYTSFPFDVNNDGWMDLIVTNDFDDPNYAYINQNGTSFIEDAAAYGLDNMIDDMGIAISDFDNDGDFDFFHTGIDENVLLQNNGANNFTDAAATFGISPTGWSWGARFSDFDLDGDEDLFVVNGYDFEGRGPEENVFFRNLHVQGQPTFENASTELGVNANTESVEVVDFDYDNDGDLDVLISNGDGSIIFYENKLLNFDDSTSTLNWFKVHLQGTISNRNAIGTSLTLTTTNGTLRRYYTGVGFLGQSLQAVHFGLDDATEVLSLEVKWPSGLVENYNTISSNTTVKLTEGDGLEILNIPPSQKIFGCTNPNSCNYNPLATLDDGSCTFLPAQSIIGNTDVAFYSSETYMYNIAEGSVANWTVDGGHILSGQGTNTITVLWEVQNEGSITVTESNGQCSSLAQSVSVSLNANDLPENISIARLWNEALLFSIRNDFARPTIHARNLFHSSVAMYDIWAIHNTEEAQTYLIGKTVHDFESEFQSFIPVVSNEESIKEAISYAMYRLIDFRFQNSPGAEAIQEHIDLLMEKLGYDTSFTSLLYEFGNPAALGNYVAQTIIDYGLQDGSRESTGFDNGYYEPVNQAYNLEIDNNPLVVDPNRWQPLGLDTFIDQGGNVVDGNVPEFLSPEWGNVNGFALQEEDMVTYTRNGDTYRVFHDPSAPPYINTSVEDQMSEQYKWGFSMVSVWQSHLDASDGVMWDISPGALGNTDISDFPTNYADYPNYYNFFEGGDIGTGHSINPATQAPYPPNIVPRADYARVLAEFWADGPDSETPPGHWFTILNYVNDHPQFEKRFQGEGEILDGLEWDVKAYFTLGGGMHDAAIAAWSVKGWYDYIRPISAIRYMGAEQGQSSDPNLPNYSVSGLKLIPGYIELVEEGDPLAGFFGQHIGKVKLYTWRGHDFINDPEVDKAGVGWILAEDWYPYQRPTFVTPPFAGYVSGHSTYSRTASELLTKLTGDPYFPGGVGEFVAKKNEFLVFEEGPTVDVVLQWATYRDASDQTSLSRIWGGIHPPADDIPGRFIGQKVADDTFAFALPFFEPAHEAIPETTEIIVYPNPSLNKEFFITNTTEASVIEVFDISGRHIELSNRLFDDSNNTTQIQLYNASTGIYVMRIDGTSKMVSIK